MGAGWLVAAGFFLAGSPEPEPGARVVVGRIQIGPGAQSPAVSLLTQQGTLRIGGEWTGELGRLHAVRVEVTGRGPAEDFLVARYRILDVGGGVTPVVGRLVRQGPGLALRDGEGSAVPLNLPPRHHARLLKLLGAKIWIAGQHLLSGELRLKRYGVLRDPPGSPQDGSKTHLRPPDAR